MALQISFLVLMFLSFILYDVAENDSNYVAKTINQSATSNIVSDGEITAAISDEKRLLRFLIKRYQLVGQSGPPVLNSSESITVKFGLGLIKLELDEKTKVLVTTMWTRYVWQDQYMVWDPLDFGGLESVRIESYHMWLPDITLYNDVGTHVLLREARAVVRYDGTITWYPQQTFSSSCTMDMKEFPFDLQKCFIMFGSWTYMASQLDLVMAIKKGIDVSTFQSDNKDVCEWDVVKHDGERKLMQAGPNDHFAVITIELHLQRKITFTTYLWTMPCVALTSLTLVVFSLPTVGSYDRTGLSMALFGSFLLLLLILVETAPPTSSSMPKLGLYYFFNMALVILSIFLSSLVVNIYKVGKNKRRVPVWLRVITIKFLGTLFCLKCKYNKTNKADILAESNASDVEEKEHGNDTSDRLSLLGNSKDLSGKMNVIFGRCISHSNDSDMDCPNHGSMVQICKQLAELKTIMEQMIYIKAKEKAQKDIENERFQRNIDEWRMVANCLDRLFFLVYLVIIVLSLFYLFPRPPYVK